MTVRKPIPCPECGCTRWYEIQQLRETERIDFNSESGIETTNSLHLELDSSDGWCCADNDHYSDEDIFTLIEEART